MVPDRDVQGRRCESIFGAAITRPVDNRGSLFRPQFLGDKWPGIDFLVELLHVDQVIPFFFVQVRSTQRGFTKRMRRLRVRLDREVVARMNIHPAPTYVAGVDETTECVYLISANGEFGGSMSTLSTEFPLDATHPKHLELLWDEIHQFWLSRGPARLASHFVDKELLRRG